MPTPETSLRKLLTVEQVFPITGRGVILTPDVPVDVFGNDGKPHSCQVEIRCPDGSSFEAEASFYVPHFRPLDAYLKFMKQPKYSCVLNGLQKSDIAVGSEIYELA